MNTIVIHISGGTLQAVYSDEPIQYILIDEDNEEQGGNIADGKYANDGEIKDIVEEFPEIKELLKK